MEKAEAFSDFAHPLLARFQKEDKQSKSVVCNIILEFHFTWTSCGQSPISSL